MIAPFVDAAWLAGHREDVVLADVRWYLDGRSGRDEFEAGHLPGAVFVDLDAYLASPPSPDTGRHPLPDPEVFARGMGEAGIGDDSTVVAYDDAGGVVAARLVWLLRALGADAALLDGGLAAGDGPLETGPASATAADFTARPWPADRLAGIDELHDGGRILLDARDRNRFSGEFEPVDPRPGHIPGARNLPARETLDGGRLLPRTSCAPSSPRPAWTRTARSSPRAARASTPATRCSSSRRSGSHPAGCSPAPTRSGATATGPSRPTRPTAA